MLNKWDYRYPYFGLQKLHMGYGYGYPIYPQLSKHKDFMSLVNRLEKRMANIEDNVSNISQDVVDELHALLEQFNEIDTIISVDDVQLIVESAIDNIEYPEQISIENVRDEITQAINQIDIGLSALEVQTMISDSIDELDVGLNEMQVKVIIHETLATIDRGLNYTQVQDLINLTLANLDVGMTEDDVVDLIQFHIQSIPIDSIQSELASLRTTIENLDTPDVDLTDIYSRLLLLESQIDEDTIYDDGWIHTEIQSLRDLIQGIETGDVDLTEVNSRLQVLESKVDNDTIYDDTELKNKVDQLRLDLDNLETGDVDLSEVNSRLQVLESKVDNDTIYDDTELKNKVDQLRLDLDNLETGDVDLSEYVKHDYLSKEEVTRVQFTPNQSPQTYQIELSESTVDVYINLTAISIESLELEIDYSHLNVDDKTELEEMFSRTQFNLNNVNLFTQGIQILNNGEMFGVEGYFHDGVYYMMLFDVGNLVHNLPLYSAGDDVPLTLTFDMSHYDYTIEYQPSPEQSISIDRNMSISWVTIQDIATSEFSDIVSSTFLVKNNSEQISEMNNTMNYLEQIVNDKADYNYIIELENRITELENRLDNLVIPETQTKDVAIVRPQGPEVYPEPPNTELAIYIGPWEPDASFMNPGDLWFNNTTGVYSMFTNDGLKQILTGQVE